MTNELPKLVEDDTVTKHAIVVLDRTGSMFSIEVEAVGGFNGFLQGLREVEGYDVFATIYQFDSNSIDQLSMREPIGKVLNMEQSAFHPRGMTNLYDAIAHAITDTPIEVGDQVTVAIVTDGGENASHEYTRENIRNLIKAKENEGWEFVYTAIGIDAWDSVDDLAQGTRSGRNVRYSGHGGQSVASASAAATAGVASFLTNSNPESLKGNTRDEAY